MERGNKRLYRNKIDKIMLCYTIHKDKDLKFKSYKSSLMTNTAALDIANQITNNCGKIIRQIKTKPLLFNHAV